MRNSYIRFMVVFLLSNVAQALEYEKLKWNYPNEEYIVMACKYAVSNTAVFCKKDSASSYNCTCSDEPALGSMMYCLYSESSINNTKVENMFQKYCSSNAHHDLERTTMRAAYQNVTSYIIDTSEIADFNKSIPIRTPIIYKPKLYENNYNSIKMRWDNVRNSMISGSGLLGYWAVIFFFATLFNFGQRITVVGKFFNSKPFNKLRQYISMPATFKNKKHTDAYYPLGEKAAFFSGLVPTRIESIIIFIWFALNFILEGTSYHYVTNNTIWKIHDAQMARYIGDKSGIMACYGFQLTFLFAGRNNFLMWLTGWKQSTFITYHKWVSRTNFLTIVVHAAAMHVQSWSYGRFYTRIVQLWYQWGIASVIAAGLMIFFGSHWFRKQNYEVFLMFHILLAVIFLIGAWIHIADFDYQNFAFAMAGIWCFDRFVRIVRLFFFGVKAATAQIISNETIKLTIPKRHFWKVSAGQYGYIHFFLPTTFLQSHPFTIVSDDDDKITIYAKIKGGITSGVFRNLAEQPNQTGTIKVSVEGPYGDSKPLKRYDTVLLYSGGNGIPGLYAHARKLVKANNGQKRIKLYWVIRNWASVKWFHEELLKLKDSGVETIIYMTRETSILTNSSSSDSDSSRASAKEAADEKTQQLDHPSLRYLEDLPFVNFRTGRPDIETIVKQDLEESTGHVAVMACAHNAMVDDIRYTVSQSLEAAKGRVDYFEELQAW